MPRPSTLLIPGQKFGFLTYIREAPSFIYKNHTARRITCQCDCGKIVAIVWQSIKRGATSSCGCHSHDSQYTHGLSKHALYKTWAGMIARCYDYKSISYDNYGGRGIKVCKAWRNNPDGLINFIKWAETNGWQPGLELDRKENDIGYAPFNCRWITRKQNACNRRDSLRVTYKDISYSFVDFWEKFAIDISYRAAVKRLKRGWNPFDAVTTPSKK